MSKKFLVGIAIFPMLVGTVMAGPFGLTMGMKKSDFEGEMKEVSPFKYIVSTVPKKHSAFDLYVVKIGPESGLCYIKAVGKEISTSTYGTELESAFDNLESKFKKAYGKNTRVDTLRYESIWDEPKDWMPGLMKGERILGAVWDKDVGSSLKDDIVDINMAANGLSYSKGIIVVDYSFTNNDACDAEIAATEDGAL